MYTWCLSRWTKNWINYKILILSNWKCRWLVHLSIGSLGILTMPLLFSIESWIGLKNFIYLWIFRASCFDSTLTVLEDPHHNRQLFLIGTTNSSTLLAERTKELIQKEKPDSVFVQTNKKWWDIVKEVQGVNNQQELNLYNNVLRKTQEWESEFGPRGLIFKLRFYPWVFLMNQFCGKTFY